MSTRYILIIGVLLLAAVVVVALMREAPPRKDSPVKAAESFSSTPPSKENASKRVMEQINHLKDVARKDSTNAAVHLELARLLQDAHRSHEAMGYYARGLTLDPSNVAARIDYSLCLYEAGKIPEAFEQNMRVLRKEPLNPEALYNLGALYANTGRNDSAKVYWERLIGAHEGHALAAKAKENLLQLHPASPAL